MCDSHRSQWRNLYQNMQQHIQMPWGYQQQYPYVSAITSHFANNSQCHHSAHVPQSLCVNRSKCYCCSAHALPACTCYIYENKGPYHCCTDGLLPVNTGYTSPMRYYPKRYPVMIEPYVPTGHVHGFKNAAKYESSSEDEDAEDSSDDSSDEDDYSSDSDSYNGIQPLSKYRKPFPKKKAKMMKKQYKGEDDSSDSESCNEIQPLSKYKQPLLKEKAEIMKKQYKGECNSSSDKVLCNGIQSKRQQAYIKKKAERLLKQYNGEDCSSDSGSEIPSLEMAQQILIKINEKLREEYEKREEFFFEISDEPNDLARFKDSDYEDSANEDEDDEDASDEYTDDEDASDEYTDDDSSDNDKDEEVDFDEDDDEEETSDEDEDPKSEERADPPRYGIRLERDAYGEVQYRFGRLSPTPLEDDLLKQKLGGFVYGDEADAICGQETLMISKFNCLSDMTSPKLWPTQPIYP